MIGSRRSTRNGVLVCRAIVSHRMPDGVVFVYHVQERTVDTPRTETTDKRGGNHNALTRVRIKPSHLAGGYGQHCVRVQLPGPDRQPARRGDRGAPSQPGGEY